MIYVLLMCPKDFAKWPRIAVKEYKPGFFCLHLLFDKPHSELKNSCLKRRTKSTYCLLHTLLHCWWQKMDFAPCTGYFCFSINATLSESGLAFLYSPSVVFMHWSELTCRAFYSGCFRTWFSASFLIHLNISFFLFKGVASLTKELDEFELKKTEARAVTGVLASHPNSTDVHISSLSLTFHGQELLSDTSLELNSGRRYGLIGLNGTGKWMICSHWANRSPLGSFRSDFNW